MLITYEYKVEQMPRNSYNYKSGKIMTIRFRKM